MLGGNEKSTRILIPEPPLKYLRRELVLNVTTLNDLKIGSEGVK
jgi:hypothetical protein